jgi:hypothetical protein
MSEIVKMPLDVLETFRALGKPYSFKLKPSRLPSWLREAVGDKYYIYYMDTEIREIRDHEDNVAQIVSLLNIAYTTGAADAYALIQRTF